MIEPFFLKSYWDQVEQKRIQKQKKAEELLGKAPLRILNPDPVGDRTRLDLMYHNSLLGIRGPSLDDKNFEFFKIEKPDSAHPLIVDMMEVFLDSRCPLKLAQIRFRVGHFGEQGIWIDCGNEELKALKDEAKWLSKMLNRGWVIEAGQKRKEFTLDLKGKIVFENAKAKCWLASYDKNGLPISLLSQIALFSQPGPEVNRAMIVSAFELLESQKISALKWMEWGAGYGNLSAGLSSFLGSSGSFSSELDEGAFHLLQTNRDKFFSELTVERKSAESDFESNHQLWVIDPPRSGFPKLLSRLNEIPNPPIFVLAYHCHEKGLAVDTLELQNAGYQLAEWIAIDAFPATPHQEVVSLWKKH